ncbi:EAL domain-containing protein [uncultured Thiodictyon sp.]|jgi:diguanylate cyclase (GGDEF)-like protein|uniref:putative bifunctional diguanylate cyclase/phosphodiesterase n=1 Tax=uncultured Thiodictyon sp. TaxID=1846217 RepID=UPI0025FD6635|nr:EAL domain-containing protein [uncultured Thiodictyon sp.]
MATFRDPTDRLLADLFAALRRDVLNPAEPSRAHQDLQLHLTQLEREIRGRRTTQRSRYEPRDSRADLYDLAPVACATLDHHGRITQLNKAATQLLEVERQPAPGLVLGSRLAPADRRVLLASLARVLSKGEDESIEVSLGHPPAPGRDLLLVIRREPPSPAEEVPAACYVALLDITEVKRTQAALTRRQGFLQSVIDSVAAPILVIGTNYQVLLTNAAALAAGPLAAEGPDGPGPAHAVLAGATAVKMIQRHLGPDGRPRWIELIGTPLRSPDGEVLGVIESAYDITTHVDLTEQLKERELQLTHAAHHDALTGLPNRFLLADRLNQAMRQAHRQNRQTAVLFLDLDRFKSINDSLGHAIGDQVLKQAAQRICAVVRESDTVARLGGDEFVVILTGLKEGSEAALPAETLLATLKEPFTVTTPPLAVTASVGISLYPQDGTDVDALLTHADAALYQAKGEGRDTFRYYTDTMTAHPFAQVSLEAALRQAVANQEFVLHYQPQHDLETGRIAGLEALIRWNHPLMGLIEPMQFIPMAESTGIIAPISAWVVRAAAAQMKAWRDQGLLSDAAVWVNLSTRDMQNPDLAAGIEDIVREAGLAPADFAVEITESWIMLNPEAAAGNIRRLQTSGIDVGIDDFGTGYSSLAALKRLAVREFKIDRSFIAALPGGADDSAIARAVIALGRALGLRVVAEGIETQAQAEFLHTEGCQFGQGFYFSRALPAAEFEVYARAQPQLPPPTEARRLQ